jgi:hypothetical protein
MAGHDMATEALIRTQGFFKVDGPRLVQPGGLAQRLSGNVHAEPLLIGGEGGDGHAGAIEGDAVPKTHVVEIPRRRLDGQALAMV